MDTLEPRLESLLMGKTFGELNAEERIFVLASLTEESYNAYHLILKHTLSDAGKDALVPSSAIPAKLKAHFEASRKPVLRVGFSMKHLSIAACLLLAVSLAVVFFKTEPSTKSEPRTNQVKVDLPTAPPKLNKSSADRPEKTVNQKLEAYAKAAPKVKPALRVPGRLSQ